MNIYLYILFLNFHIKGKTNLNQVLKVQFSLKPTSYQAMIDGKKYHIEKNYTYKISSLND